MSEDIFSSFSANVDRLDQAIGGSGGLSAAPGAAKHKFTKRKKPTVSEAVSRFGLDELAKKKRREKPEFPDRRGKGKSKGVSFDFGDGEEESPPRKWRRNSEGGPNATGGYLRGGGGRGQDRNRDRVRDRDRDRRRRASDSGEYLKRAEEELDRDWYLQDEGGAFDDEQRHFNGDERVWKSMEQRRKDDRPETQPQQPRKTALQRALDNDGERWEEAQLVASGIVQRGRVNLDIKDEDADRIHLIVKDVRPRFLEGAEFKEHAEMISVVKDANSDLVTVARRGSRSLKDYREQKDKNKGRKRFWEVAGSKMGAATGEQGTAEERMDQFQKEQQEEQADGEDYKAKSQYKNTFRQQGKESTGVIARRLVEQRRSLPIYRMREQLLQLIRENQIVVIVGETGSGKTTQLTQFLHAEGYTRGGMIGCTQPRRVAAVSVAKRVSEEMGVNLGEEVGYAIRFEDNTSEKTVIKYMTDGVLLRESLTDKTLEDYSVIVMDEAHERSLHTDVLFGLLRSLAEQRRDLKILITSATMNAERFGEFFNCPVTYISGRAFPVEAMYAKATVEDYVDATVKQCMSIHLSEPLGDILVFMTGQEEIEAVCAILAERLEELEEGGGVPPISILPIFSQLPSDLQAKIFDKAEAGTRKCIVATNIAETSLTVDGIKYVVDAGYCKLKVYNPKIGMDALQVTPISKAQAMQRTGRAGRTSEGKCFRLYTAHAFRYEMLENMVPEIQRTNLGNVILLLKSLDVYDVLDFPFMDPPTHQAILNSMYQLYLLDALDSEGQLTRIGRRMVQFPLDPPLSKMLIMADELGCSEEVLTIVSMLSVPTVFFRPPDRQEESDAAREKFFVPLSDHLTLLNVFTQWLRNRKSSQWCVDHFIQYKAMRKAMEVRAQLRDIMVSGKYRVVSCHNDWDVIRKAVCSGYFYHACKLKGISEYVNLRTGLTCHLHPTSALFGLGMTADYLVYHELVMTSKEYMQHVTAVDPTWLGEIGDKFFQVRSGHDDPISSRREDREAEKKEQAQAQARREAEEARAVADAADLARLEELRTRQRIAVPGVRTTGKQGARRHRGRMGL